MKKCLYLAEWNFSPGNGISNKILAQRNALNNLFHTDLCFLESERVLFNEKVLITKGNSLIGRIIKYYSLFKVVKKQGYDLIYVRHINGFNSLLFYIFIQFLSSKTKVNIEVPTYPFSGEQKNAPISIGERISRFIEEKYKNRVSSVTYMGSHTEEIWGIPAIKFDNGVNVEDFRLIPIKKLEDELHIIGVGSLDFWHGYDRAIEGVAQSTRKVFLHIVGEGIELDNLKNQSSRLGIDKNVKFYGRLHSKALDDVFSKCHIAIDSLGRHRSGNEVNSSIKSKEYTARGIGFIQSHIDEVFNQTNFVFKVPNDDTPINFDIIFDWYLEANLSPRDIREFAKKNLEWSMQFNKLFDFYKF